MEDVRAPQKKDEAASKSKKNRTLTLRVNRDVFMIGVAVVLILVAYFYGVHNGRDQINKDQKAGMSDLNRTAVATSARWTSVGTVQEVSNSSIKIVDTRKETKQVKIAKDTVVVGRTGEKISAKEIKKGQRVIVSGTTDDKNNLTATRIRIQL